MTASIITSLLLSLFPEADKCCKDVGRLFLGGKKLLYEDVNAEVNIKDLAVSVQGELLERDSSNYSKNVKRLGKKLGVEVKNNVLAIHQVMGHPENYGFRINSNTIIMESIQDPYNLYIIEKPDGAAGGGKPLGAEGTHQKSALPLIQNKTYRDIARICPLFRDFYERDLPHAHKFFLATNLIHIKGGKKLFFDGLKEHHGKWEIEWRYIKGYGYNPQNCGNAGCPYGDTCRCKSLYHKLASKIKRVAGEEPYVPLEDAVSSLDSALREALGGKAAGIYLVKAQTAIGKTTAYCSMARCWGGEKPLMVAVPTVKLQHEVYGRMQYYGVDACMTPNITGLLGQLGQAGLLEEIQELYGKGFGYRVKRAIREYMENNKDRLDVGQLEALGKCLKGPGKLDGSKCVVTTHAMLLALPVGTLRKYEVIVDEDILMTAFKNTGSVSFQDMETSLEKNIFQGGLGTGYVK